MAVTPAAPKATPEALLRALIAKLPLKSQPLFRSIRSALRKRMPTANELVYDYKTSMVISYTPTEHGIDGVLSLAARADGIRLYFGGGPRLPDPKRLLLGSAGTTRYIEVAAASRLANPDVKALIAAAIEQAKIPLPAKRPGRVIDRSVAQKRRRQREE